MGLSISMTVVPQTPLPGHLNVLADQLSRTNQVLTTVESDLVYSTMPAVAGIFPSLPLQSG